MSTPSLRVPSEVAAGCVADFAEGPESDIRGRPEPDSYSDRVIGIGCNRSCRTFGIEPGFTMEYFPSIVCAVLLTFFLCAFVFSPSLRKDLSAGEGKANIFNLISVKGAVIISLLALFLGGMVYAFPFVTSDDIEGLRTDLTESKRMRLDLEKALESAQTLDIADIVENLDPADTLSGQLRGIQQMSRGPWSQFSSSRRVLVSVPGTNAEDHSYQRIVYGCGRYYQQQVQIISDSENSRGRAVTVTVAGVINNATNCAELAGGVDLQLDCDTATGLLTSQVLTCDEEGNPLWSESMRGQEKLFPAFAVILVNLEGSASARADDRPA